VSLERFGAVTVLHRLRRELESIRRRCVIISFDMEALAVARSQRWPAIGAVVDHWGERKQFALRALKPQYLFCDIDGLPRWGKLAFDGARLVVYEVDQPALALKLARRGVHFIETFAIGEMREAVGG
jgi:glycerophosphoryl diester phosphodiesterase